MSNALSDDTISELREHESVARILNSRHDDEVTAVIREWKYSTEVVRELIKIAGEDATMMTGDTRTHLRWGYE